MKAPRLLLSALRQGKSRAGHCGRARAGSAQARAGTLGRLLTRSTSCGSHKQVGVFTPGELFLLAKRDPHAAHAWIDPGFGTNLNTT
jgi:hypothetical protein